MPEDVGRQMGKEKIVERRVGLCRAVSGWRVQTQPGPDCSAGDLCRRVGDRVALGAWRAFLAISDSSLKYYVIVVALLAAGVWIGYRIVNMPQFADFLIAVEAEMNKVSWPSRAELVRSSVVVILVIFLLAIVLFGFDLLWQFLFSLIGVRP